ncbi:hypothetical protein Tco_0315724 [Tanacetum coccineum]
MERFENTIFKQREEINDRMTEMFRLLKELMTSRTPEKVLIREEAKFLVTKNVNSIFLARGEEERSDKTDETLDNTVKPTASPGMGRKDKASLGKGDGVQPMEEQKFQRQASHSYYNQGRMDDEGEVTLYLMRRSLEVLRKFHWTILG